MLANAGMWAVWSFAGRRASAAGSLAAGVSAVAADATALIASERALAIGSTIGTADGHSYKVLAAAAVNYDLQTAGGARLEVRPGPDGVYEIAAWALDETGATDVGAAFSAVLARAVKLRLTRGAKYLFGDYNTVANVPGARLWCNGAVIRAAGLPHPMKGRLGVLNFDACPGAQVHDFQAHGDEDTDTWLGLSNGQRAVPRALLRFAGCPDSRVHSPVTSGLPYGIIFDAGSVRSEVYSPSHVGICGPIGDVLPNVADAGAGVCARGAHRTKIINPAAREVAQGVLGQSTVLGLQVEGGTGDEIHNCGVYVSSGHDCAVRRYTCRKVKGDGVKMRGSRNIIDSCKVLEGDTASTGFVISGLVNSAAIDSLGATGSGSKIVNCTASNIGFLATVRLATISAVKYAMRDVEITGCQGFGMTNDAGAPITAFVVRDANISDNSVDRSGAPAAIQILGMNKHDAVGIVANNNRFGAVLRGVEVLNATAPAVTNNSAEASRSFFIRFTNCHSPMANDNSVSVITGSILDIRAGARSITGVPVARRNKGTISVDTNQQWDGVDNGS
ncbi:hypothetical protein [Sphingopyxis panaciterrae]